MRTLVQIDSYEEAALVLGSYNPLPAALQIPAYLHAMNEVYGHRNIASGRVRSLVERYENLEFLAVTPTPDHEPAFSPKARFERDVKIVADLLELEPNTHKLAVRYKSQFWTDPRKILWVIQNELAYGWATIKHIKAAMTHWRQARAA